MRANKAAQGGCRLTKLPRTTVQAIQTPDEMCSTYHLFFFGNSLLQAQEAASLAQKCTQSLLASTANTPFYKQGQVCQFHFWEACTGRKSLSVRCDSEQYAWQYKDNGAIRMAVQRQWSNMHGSTRTMAPARCVRQVTLVRVVAKLTRCQTQ